MPDFRAQQHDSPPGPHPGFAWAVHAYTASGAVLPVMFQAALQGFPNPPAGERRVDIEIPTAKQ